MIRDEVTGKLYDDHEMVHKFIDWAISERLMKDNEVIRADAIKLMDGKFTVLNGNVVRKSDGLAFDAAMKDELDSRTSTDPNSNLWGVVVLTDTMAEAWGEGCTMAARAKRLRELQLTHPEKDAQALFEAEAAAWGCSLTNLKPGTKPTENARDETNKKSTYKDDKRLNPWLVDSPGNLEERIRIVQRMGTKVAAALAKAAGKSIMGAPLRK